MVPLGQEPYRRVIENGVEVLYSLSEYDASPEATQEDRSALVGGLNGFAFDLYQQLRGTGGNLFYSPYSISTAFGMAYAGAQGETAQQIADAFNFTLPQGRLHETANALSRDLTGRTVEYGEENVPFTLNVANSQWGQRDLYFLPGFVDTLTVNYGAGMRLLDFRADPNGSREKINGWVSDRTNGKIPELFAPGMISNLTRLVLANAIYFNARWQNPFPENLTENGVFTLLDNTEVAVPMMLQEAMFPYAAGSDYVAVRLPYWCDVSMVIIMPSADNFQGFENSLDAGKLSQVENSLQTSNLLLKMPKFSFGADINLKDVLYSMGVTAPFTEEADFSGITGDRSLFIGEAVHKAFVSVDEKGTEAAAATGIGMEIIGIPPSPISVTINHPFLFFIEDDATGAILFMGRVLNPA